MSEYEDDSLTIYEGELYGEFNIGPINSKLLAVGGSNMWELLKTHEDLCIGIYEDQIGGRDTLAPFIYKYYDGTLRWNIMEDWGSTRIGTYNGSYIVAPLSREFDYYGANYFTYDQIHHMAEEIRESAAHMMAGMEATANFRRRFADLLENMMEKAPECDLVCFYGP